MYSLEKLNKTLYFVLKLVNLKCDLSHLRVELLRLVLDPLHDIHDGLDGLLILGAQRKLLLLVRICRRRSCRPLVPVGQHPAALHARALAAAEAAELAVLAGLQGDVAVLVLVAGVDVAVPERENYSVIFACLSLISKHLDPSKDDQLIKGLTLKLSYYV